MERFVAVLEAVEDLDRLVHRRLAHEHRLEAPLERRVALDVLAVLVERRRSDDVKLAAGKRRLEHVAGIHRAFGTTGTDERVQLVDEEDDVLLVLGDLVDHLLQALFELASVLRPGNHACEVELHDPPLGQRLGYLFVHDSLRDALDDGRLPDAGVADQCRIVLRPPREDLDRLLDLVGAPDDRIELALACKGGEVPSVLVERRRLGRLSCASRFHAADHRAPKPRVRDAELLQELSGLTLVIARQRKKHVLGADVGVAQLARLVVRRQERSLGIGGERG